jgi:membrane protein YqaA with SNARE-associated domain
MASATTPPEPPILPAAKPDPVPSRISDEELRDYVQRNLVRGGVGLVALVGLLALVGKYFEPQLLGLTTWTYQTVGFVGLASILAITDSFISPIPPDMLLVVVAKSDLAASWWIAVPALGVLSSIAGVAGWAMSRQIGTTRLPQLLFGRYQRYNQALVDRYGSLAVALGALTPIPFSVTCWTAGMFQLPFDRMVWATLLRVPRFVGYYLLIHWSVNLL